MTYRGVLQRLSRRPALFFRRFDRGPFEDAGGFLIAGAIGIEQGVESGVVAGLQQMHELVGNDHFQARGRIGGKLGIDANRYAPRRA